MSEHTNKINCPKCNQTGLITCGFFAACVSEDCSWIGSVSSVGSSCLMQDALIVGFSQIIEKLYRDPVYGANLLNLMAAIEKNLDTKITVDSIIEEDKMGSIYVHHGKKNKQYNGEPIDSKLYALKSIQRLFVGIREDEVDNINADKENSFRKSSFNKDGNLYTLEEWGFPPLNARIESDNTGIRSLEWNYGQNTTIWQPIDWSVVKLDKDVSIQYLGVLQVRGQNVTYVAQENLDTSEWSAGVSTREYGQIKGTFIPSSAQSIEEAKDKLTKHFNKTFNGMVEEGVPLELGWSKEFGYDEGYFHVLNEFLNSDVIKDDASNEMLFALNTTREEMYEEMFNSSFSI